VQEIPADMKKLNRFLSCIVKLSYYFKGTYDGKEAQLQNAINAASWI
jgi:hypothetical protein